MNANVRTQIIEQLKPVLSRASNGRANLERITEQSLIIEDIGLSSLDLLELRCELEEGWNTRITDEEAIRLRTIGDVVKVILMHTGSRGVQ
jgi:acyl carrier protein